MSVETERSSSTAAAGSSRPPQHMPSTDVLRAFDDGHVVETVGQAVEAELHDHPQQQGQGQQDALTGAVSSHAVPYAGPAALAAHTGAAARPCWRCGATEGVRAYLIGPACPEHTPAALAGRPEPAPPADSTLAALRERRGIAAGAHQPPAATVVDERAVASGKRTSANHVHQAAIAARRRSRTGRR